MLYNHIFPLAGGASSGSSESSQQQQRQPQTVVEEKKKEEENKLVLPPAKPHIVSEMKGFEQEEPSLQTQEQRKPEEESHSSLMTPDQASLPLTGELRSGIQLCSVKLCNCFL